MTTLKDILNDLAEQVKKNEWLEPEYRCDSKTIVDEYVTVITERLIGFETRSTPFSF